MKALILFVAAAVVLLGGAISEAAETAPIAKYVEAVRQIKSYDTQYQLTRIALPKSDDVTAFGNTAVSIAPTNLFRDTVAFNSGRRFESNIGDPQFHSIWVRGSTDNRAAKDVIAVGLDMSYRDYFDPFLGSRQVGKGGFLSDWVKRTTTHIRQLNSTGDLNQLSFEISNSDLIGPVNLRLDPQRGFTVSEIDVYRADTSGRVMLCLSKTHVSKYIRHDSGTWVPVEATLVRPTGIDPTKLDSQKGMFAATGLLLEVRADRSTWNSFEQANSLIAEGLPAANHATSNGWKQELASAPLEAAHDIDAAERQAARTGTAGPGLRLVLISLNVVAVVAIAAFIAYKRFSRRVAL